MINVLHIDDDLTILDFVKSALEGDKGDSHSFSVTSIDEAGMFESMLQGHSYELIILDISLKNSETSGIDLIDIAKKVCPSAKILMCSSLDDVVHVRKSLKKGVDDFVSKGATAEEIRGRVINILSKKGKEYSELSELSADMERLDIVGETMQKIARRVPQILSSAVRSVHIFGETGVGKEVVAEIFEKFRPENVPFVKINCGAIAPSLMESELFGHVKGSFTGANKDKVGLIEQADDGWIFMDEVATLSMQAQISLLRVLENGTLRKVGSTAEKRINVRIVSATNEPIPELIKANKFRDDLWQRLCEVRLEVPPLRERKKEIPLLIEHFAAQMDGGPYVVERAAINALSSFPWSYGNIRELRNCLRAMTERRVGNVLSTLSVPKRLWDSLDRIDSQGSDQASASNAAALSDGKRLIISWGSGQMPELARLNDLVLLEAVKNIFEHKGRQNISQLSRHLNVSRSTLSARLHGLVTAEIVTNDQLSTYVSLGQSKSAG